MKSSALSFLLLFATLTLVFGEEELREWTNTSGKTISAKLMGLEGETVTLRLDKGRQYDIAVSTLSEGDRTYIEEWRAAQEAMAAGEEMGLQLGVPADVIVETAFDEETPPTRKGEVAGWTAGIGEWRIEERVLIGDEVPEDNHASSLTYRLEATDMIITAQVRLGTATQIAFACRDTIPPNLHLGRLYITQDRLWIQSMTGISKSTTSERLVAEDVSLDREAWYDVTIEIIGDRYRATVGDHEIEATHSRFADAKGIVALINRGEGAGFRNVALWNAASREE